MDSAFLIALVNPKDQWHQAAVGAGVLLGPARFVTTDEVLTEFLNALSGAGETLRRQAVASPHFSPATVARGRRCPRPQGARRKMARGVLDSTSRTFFERNAVDEGVFGTAAERW